MTKKRRKLKTWPIVSLFILVILGITIYCIIDICNSLKTKETKEIKIVNEIEAYGYRLNENDPAYVSDLFSKLKKELEEEIVDEEKYVTFISQMFIADFYTLNQAINKNDIGGVQFVLKSNQEKFKKKAKDTVYRYVENNIYHDRKQSLPVVDEVIVTNIEKKMYNADTVTDGKAYYVTCTVHYKEELNYPTNVSLIFVHQDKKLELVSMK